MADALYGPTRLLHVRRGAPGAVATSSPRPRSARCSAPSSPGFVDATSGRPRATRGFMLVDAGAGPGRDGPRRARRRPSTARHRSATSRSTCQRRSGVLHPAGVESRAELPAGPFDGVVVANELLDNLPFRLAVHDGGWREAYVVAALRRAAGRDAQRPVRPGAGDTAGARRARRPGTAPGRRRERGSTTLATASDRGTLLVIDYMPPTTAALADRPWREWLRTYREHSAASTIWPRPARRTSRARSRSTSCRRPTRSARSRSGSSCTGSTNSSTRAGGTGSARGHAPDLAAMRMRSRVGEAEALLDPSGLGAFTVLEYRAG